MSRLRLRIGCDSSELCRRNRKRDARDNVTVAVAAAEGPIPQRALSASPSAIAELSTVAVAVAEL